jgi:hypothetical protein
MNTQIKNNTPHGRRTSHWLGAVLVTLSLLIGGCVPTAQSAPGNQEPAATEIPLVTPTPVKSEILPTIRAPKMVPVDPIDPGPPVTGEAPIGLLEDIRADLAEKSGAALEAMVVIRDQAVTWSDGSLGCPQPGMMYTQALVPGYWVVLQVGEVEYDYHAAESGYFVLCEGGGLPYIQTPNQ